MKFARYSFLIAGIYGLLSLSPMYFLEAKNGRDFPPAITHPEFYYGFIGVALAWQVLFLVLSINPKRYRPMMIPAMLEKLSFAVPVIVLFLQNRVASLMVIAAVPDLLFLGLFVAAFIKTRGES
jgi:hypothetical protein